MALELRSKPLKKGQKGKELDSRWFDENEWKASREADAEQWKAHLKTGAIRIVPQGEAKSVDESRILPIPSRFVRTNKDKSGGLMPKSRLVVPGHLAPSGEVRTDAPVAPQFALYILLSMVALCGWTLGTFDVADAFLSGENNSRRLYVRPPREGIPGVPDGSLLELVKGVFGLKESPRLWWLKLQKTVLDCGFTAVRGVPGVFLFKEPAKGQSTGQVVGMLVVHVDDGCWAGTGPHFERAQTKLRKGLAIGKEASGTFELLGRRVTHNEHGVKVDQHDYIMKVKHIDVARVRRREKDSPLTNTERTQYLSLVQQLSWPARSTLPALCYHVSALQQRAAQATVADLVAANKALDEARSMVQRDMCLWFKAGAFTVEELMVTAVHDASFANETNRGSQQGCLVTVGPKNSLEEAKEYSLFLIDWSSIKLRSISTV